MKRFITLAMLCTMVVLGCMAQYRGAYGGGSYKPVVPSTHRYGGIGHYNRWGRPYGGLRIGPTFSAVTGDDGSSMRSGVNIGLVGGFPLSSYVPLYFETGLSYTEKGGKDDVVSVKLDYLELPLVFKYKAFVGDRVSIEPYMGGFAALGVGGKIKDRYDKTAVSSFGEKDYQFRRGDAGIKLGCGIGFDMFYADINYDWGLANICHDSYMDGHTGALTINVGINF